MTSRQVSFLSGSFFIVVLYFTLNCFKSTSRLSNGSKSNLHVGITTCLGIFQTSPQSTPHGFRSSRSSWILTEAFLRLSHQGNKTHWSNEFIELLKAAQSMLDPYQRYSTGLTLLWKSPWRLWSLCFFCFLQLSRYCSTTGNIPLISFALMFALTQSE